MIEKLRYHPVQQEYYNSKTRFNVVPAGRRSGKTELAKRKLVKRALLGTKFFPARFFAAAPVYNQAKNIYWPDLKRYVLEYKRILSGLGISLDVKIVETELKIILPRSEIVVFGMDKPERMEGQPWDGGVLDEYANMRARAWGENVRPALSDRNGWCDFIGVPEGWNHYKDLYDYSLLPETVDWSGFHWISADILPKEEIESAKRDLDELTFRQEYEATFENFAGRAYYSFNREFNCAKLDYNPKAPIIFCFDFNVDPGVAAVCQEQKLPNGEDGTAVIGEVYIPRNSTTESVANKLVNDWKDHQGRIVCYGDATGGARGSAKVQGSDWEIIKKIFRKEFGDRVTYDIPQSNPYERSRINSVNSRIKSTDGTVRLMVDPSRAINVLKDFEGVTLLEGGSGELDKKRSPELTHISDAIGYYINKRFPVKVAGKSKVAILAG